jgi:hypothetical protein
MVPPWLAELVDRYAGAVMKLAGWAHYPRPAGESISLLRVAGEAATARFFFRRVYARDPTAEDLRQLLAAPEASAEKMEEAHLLLGKLADDYEALCHHRGVDP